MVSDIVLLIRNFDGHRSLEPKMREVEREFL